MKVLLLSLLLLLLCSTQVLTLKCYTCANSSDSECRTETDCAASANFCKIVVFAGTISSRTCEASCENDDFTNCCQSDLCE